MKHETVKQFNLKLKDYIGGKAQPWHFTTSHDRFAVRFKDAKGLECFLVFLWTKKLCTPNFWIIRCPLITAKEDGILLFTDADVEIEFEELVMQKEYP